MIKNIIFDLGGVLLNVNYQSTANAFEKLGIQNFKTLYSQALQSTLFDDLEIGAVSPEEFRNSIRLKYGISSRDEDIDKAWNAMLLDLPKNRIELLMNVRKHYKIFLLSNTNEIHLKAYTHNLQVEHQISGLHELFDHEYFSHQIHLRKPHADIFNYVLKNERLIAEETLFIDDSIQHVHGALRVGIKAIHLDVLKGATVSDLFSLHGILKNEKAAKI